MGMPRLRWLLPLTEREEQTQHGHHGLSPPKACQPKYSVEKAPARFLSLTQCLCLPCALCLCPPKSPRKLLPFQPHPLHSAKNGACEQPFSFYLPLPCALPCPAQPTSGACLFMIELG